MGYGYIQPITKLTLAPNKTLFSGSQEIYSLFFSELSNMSNPLKLSQT